MEENKQIKSIVIDGDKNGFLSKNCIHKFKLALKENNFNNLNNLEQISKKFIKSNYKIEIINQSNDCLNLKINLIDLTSNTEKNEETSRETPNVESRTALKSKLNILKKSRLNNYNLVSNKKKLDVDVPKDILDEYAKLMKISKIPVPDPVEILQNPEQYKPMISMFINNKMMKQIGSSHPYSKYFKLLAKKLELNQVSELNQNDQNNEKELIRNIQGKKISQNEDSETESESETETKNIIV